MERKRIYIVAKTYPTISAKYAELVWYIFSDFQANYKCSYKFEDDSGNISKMMIADLEIGMLYFNCLKRARNNEKEAVNKVKDKYLTEYDLYFFFGTTKAFHKIAPNPFIIGVFYPPKDTVDQLSFILRPWSWFA